MRIFRNQSVLTSEGGAGDCPEGPGVCVVPAMAMWFPVCRNWKLGCEDSTGDFSQPPRQDYEALKERCLRDGCLFEDKSFPATLSSIGSGPLLRKLPSRLKWRRPPELHSNPLFYSAKAKRLYLCQGLVGDCWFLAALQALSLHQDILSRVVPLNQSFTEKYAGIFQFWFWHFGKWVPVVVDDRLPVNEAGQLVFVSSTYKNLFWGALLEKAYAKLSGSYEDLQCGQVSEALVDFTGGVTMTINLAEAPDNLWDVLTRAIYSRTLIGCQTHCGNEQVLENGLVDGHAYTLTGIRKVTTSHGPEYLVRLRNPWGKIEWRGDWSDRMSLRDFKAHFMLLVICKLSPGLLTQEVGQKWSYTMLEGRWENGRTAGGQMKSPLDTFWKNPQFLLSIWRPQEGRRSRSLCSVLVSLLQKPRHRHRNRKPHLAIGFYLFRMNQSFDAQKKLPSEFFWKNASLSCPATFLTEKEVSQELWLEPGTEIGSNSSVIFSKEIVDQSEGKDEFFTKLFEKYPEINAIQLQNILNHMPWSGLGSKQPLFSLEACQGILALLDVSFQEVFHKQDTNQSGSLNWAQLRAAMREAGIVLSDGVCQLMLIRYGGPDLQMNFVSFVHLMLRVENMEGFLDSQKGLTPVIGFQSHLQIHKKQHHKALSNGLRSCGSCLELTASQRLAWGSPAEPAAEHFAGPTPQVQGKAAGRDPGSS
ncbi:hypothetical protein MJT46_003213 [Ovis ammon polii x Ovis aries]|nr:hypothetical protein MJT46_003213 [Ovis ammon polii x Ovis aries]